MDLCLMVMRKERLRMWGSRIMGAHFDGRFFATLELKNRRVEYM